MIDRGVAIVLCGGESRRMGKTKAWLELGGEPLLSRVCRVVSSVVNTVIVVAAPGQTLPQLTDQCRLRYDDQPGEGPLVAIASMLRHLPDSTTHAFLVGCDYPFLTQKFIETLRSRIGDRDLVALSGDRPQPLCAWYRVDGLREASQLVENGERRLIALYDRLSAKEVSPDSLYPGVERAVRNVNTPEAYQQAIAEYEQGETKREEHL